MTYLEKLFLVQIFIFIDFEAYVSLVFAQWITLEPFICTASVCGRSCLFDILILSPLKHCESPEINARRNRILTTDENVGGITKK